MPKRSLILLLVLVALLATAVGSARPSAARKLDTAFRSQALGGKLHFEVYLPRGYAASERRYPVVYFLHGLPSSPDGYRSVGFLERALDGLRRPAIVVSPQAARPGERDPEYLDRGRGDRWETAIARELPRVVDARFRTIRSRDGRALVGLSAGGYGAMLLALHHLDEFAVVESWSGYFHPTDPAGTRALDLGSPAGNAHASAHAYVPRLKRTLARRPTFIGFYVGRDDDRFRDENERLDRELSEAGVPHVFRLYPGGHEHAVWQAHAPAWLTLALDHLAAPR